MKRLASLFWELFKISLFVIGGGYAILIVADRTFSRKGWIKEGELLDHLPVFQMIPGLIATHTAVYVGNRVAGAFGAFAGVAAVALPSVAIFTAVSAGYSSVPLDAPWLASLFIGLRAALTGTILATLIGNWRRTVRTKFDYAVLAAAISLLATGTLSVAAVLVGAIALGVMVEFADASPRRGTFMSVGLPFLLFLKYGLLCFGGGFVLVPLYLEDFVGATAPYLQVTEAAFSDLMALTQMTPGPIGVNGATYFGFRFGGVLGAIAASAGLLLPGSLLAFAAIRSLERFKASRIVKGILRGVRPAAVALMMVSLWAFASMCVWDGAGTGRTTWCVFGPFGFNAVAAVLTAGAAFAVMSKKVGVVAIIFASSALSAIFRA